MAAHSRAMRRGWWRPALLALLVGASTALSCSAVVRCKVRHLARDNPQVLYRVETQAKAVALTIDDGPDAATTPEILRVLEQNGAHATFFIITSRVPGNEELLRRIVAEGHELGNHLVRDEPSLKLPPAEFERQLVESHELLSRFAPMRWFRPGSGHYDARMLATLEAHGYRCALGSVYPFDPQIRWSWFSKRFILSNVQAGSVIILHDWDSKGRRTVKTLSNVLPQLAKRGLRVVTLTQLESLSRTTNACSCPSSGRHRDLGVLRGEPVLAPTLGRGAAAAREWIEAEAVWPDGRRVFASSDAAVERD